MCLTFGLQLKIGPHIRKAIWKFPGGLSDEGESLGMLLIQQCTRNSFGMRSFPLISNKLISS